MIKLTKEQIKDIRKNPNNQNWYIISSNYILSEDFIREFKDKVNWSWISFRPKLSEDFIKEFQDKVNWYSISRYQKLSDKFIRQNISKLDKQALLKNENISEEIKQNIKKGNMKISKGQFIKILFRNNTQAEGKVEVWERGNYILSSDDGKSLLIVQDPIQDIMAIKVYLNQDNTIKQNNNLSKEDRDFIEKEDKDLKEVNEVNRAKKIAELHLEKIAQEKKIISERLKNHYPTSGIDFTNSKYKNIFIK